MTLSGIDDMLAELGRESSEQMNNRDSFPNLTIAQTAEMRSIVAKNFTSTALLSEVKAKLLERCDPVIDAKCCRIAEHSFGAEDARPGGAHADA